MWDGRLGDIDMAKHRIPLMAPDVRDITSARCRAGPKAHEFEKVYIDKMLLLKVIELAHSKLASPTIFAPEKDGSLRFCIDYGNLNAVTIK